LENMLDLKNIINTKKVQNAILEQEQQHVYNFG